MPRMHFHRFYLDSLAHASYLIADGDEAAVIDPRRDVDEYLAWADQHRLRIRYALATHVHADFVAGLAELRDAARAEIVMGERFDGAFACQRLGEGDQLRVGGLRIRALATPGHTPESSCFLVEGEAGAPGRLFTGDTLFIGDVGRPDLVAGRGFAPADMAKSLWHSLHDTLAPLSDATQVWPGHGAGSACGSAIGCEESSTLGLQRAANWAFGVGDPDAFASRLLQAQRPAPRYFARAAAQNRQGPKLVRELQRPREIDAAAVTRAVAAGAQVLDVRSNLEHGAAHWPGSINIGLRGNFEPWCGALLVPEQPVVVHAKDAGSAERAWLQLLRIGFDNVAAFTTALPLRTEAHPNLQPFELQEILQRDRAGWQVIDVRRPGEYQAGHVQGAVHAELGPELPREPALAGLDRDKPTAVICLGGYRSSAAIALLRQAGFRQLHNVFGGFRLWAGSGLPVER
jgi:glyoxylase-like metal-dependent hydrolase (beta-lactamase superfamily II)/3-mercaptopyruvate sulfurtransferase SseA